MRRLMPRNRKPRATERHGRHDIVDRKAAAGEEIGKHSALLACVEAQKRPCVLGSMRADDGGRVCVTARHNGTDDMAAPEPPAKRECLDPAGAAQHDALGICQEPGQEQFAIRAEGHAINSAIASRSPASTARITAPDGGSTSGGEIASPWH